MRAIETLTSRDSHKFSAVCRELLGRGLSVRFRAHGASMRPNIMEGDTIVVAPVSNSGVRRGDVVLTDTECGLKSHRVIQRSDATGAVITRGDSGQENDQPALAALGKIIIVERQGRATSATGLRARIAAKSNSAMYRAKMSFWSRTARFVSYIFPASLLLFFCLIASVSPASAAADLAITETASPALVAPGGAITYSITVTNNGGSGSGNAATPQWVHTFPGTVSFTSVAKPSGWTCSNTTTTVTCADGSDMASGTNASFTLVLTVAAGTAGETPVAGSVTVSSSTSDPVSSNNTATNSVTVTAADLAITQAASPTTVSPGGTITYTVGVTNNGPSTAAVPVFTEATPSSTTFSSVTPAAGWTCTKPAVGATGTITCTDGSNLANAGTAAFTVVVTVNAGVTDGSTISATANITSTTFDSASGNNAATSSVTVSAPADLAISQTASAPVVAAGANVVYTVVVTNNGPNQSQNVVFYENIPANTTFQSIGTVPTGWTCTTPAVGGTTPINCSIATLANAGTATFTVTLKVSAATAAETAIQNVTSVTSNTTNDPVASNNTSTTTTLVGITGNADLQLTLSASPAPVFVSSPLVYTVAVQNLGVADATTATITDTLPGTATFVSATASQGSCSQSAGVVTCNLGTLTAGTTATATITVTAPGTSGSLSDTASTTSAVTDPFTSNNSATLVTFVQPFSCATPARDGAGGTLAGNVNTYYAPSAPVVLAPGAKTVTLSAASGSTTPIAVGDLLLVIQMQDAAINSTNTGAYGDGTAGDPATGYSNANSSGRHEFVTATSALSTAGGALTFSGAGPSGGLLNTYTAADYSAGVQGKRTFQVIRVPQYQSATLGSTLAPIAWNGTVGGVLVIDVAGQLTLGGTVSANALGFRGGGGRTLTGGTGASQTDYITLATFASNGSKGEGIAGTPQYLVNSTLSALINTGVEGLPNGSYARGAPGNAGGGGTDANPAANDENSGGGGGGNGSGGGNGGYAWNTASLGNGFGGAPFPGSVSSLIMGGGGGAGTTNNGTADPTNGNPSGINSSGAAGGGIIIIHAGSVVGTGTITANGQTALDVQNDGAGGGGAGGSIELLTLSGGISGVTLSANGGTGGDTWLTSGPGGSYPGNRHGPGRRRRWRRDPDFQRARFRERFAWNERHLHDHSRFLRRNSGPRKRNRQHQSRHHRVYSDSRQSPRRAVLRRRSGGHQFRLTQSGARRR